MHTSEELTPGERELEAALRGVAASASGIDPPALAYRLGQASERARVRRWQRATGGVALAALVLGLSGQWERPGALPRESGEIVSGMSESAPYAAIPAASDVGRERAGAWKPSRLVLASAYLRQRERALRLGESALGGDAGSDEGAAEQGVGAPLQRAEPAAPGGQRAIDFFLQALSAGRRL
jgi:hypothetical protein